MFALILPKQVFAWVNNLEEQITPHNQGLLSDSCSGVMDSIDFS
jgi:hypothetical protein